MCISLTAYSCRDSRGVGPKSSPHSLLSPSRDTGAIFAPRYRRGTARLGEIAEESKQDHERPATFLCQRIK